MFFYLIVVYTKQIIITPYDDQYKHLIITKGRVRMSYTNDRRNDIFTIDSIQMTKIKQGDDRICGKLEDPGVVTCRDQSKKIRFSFVDKGDYYNIKTEDNLCLSIKGEDEKTGGNFLNLKKCKDSNKQKFKYYRVISTDKENKDDLYVNRKN